MPNLTHLDEHGRASMVDVGQKPVSQRQAIASGIVHVRRETLQAITENRIAKGEVLAVARVAGIMAAKRCGELIPLCHSLALDSIAIDFKLPDGDTPVCEITIRANARITAKTGVEMEALTAVSVAALTIYDMCKAIDKTMRISDIHLIEKTK